jgi:deoxyribose-phosphate aldolase
MGPEARKLLRSIVACLDLTSLKGPETEGEIGPLCDAAILPARGLPHAAAVCVLGPLVPVARRRLAGTEVRLAAAAGAFPEGTAAPGERVAEITEAIRAGADEIDTVLDHRALLAGREADARAGLAASRRACGERLMKVILETGALPSEEHVRSAVRLAVEEGADFVKSSTGKAAPGVTPASAAAMMRAVRELETETGRKVGVKLSGGIRTAEQSLGYARLFQEVLGGRPEPRRFRIGASSLLDDLVRTLAGSCDQE